MNKGNSQKREILELKVRVEKLENLIEATGIIAATLNLDTLLDMIMEIGLEMMEAEGCSILLLDENKKKLQFVAASGKRKDTLKKLSVKVGEGFAGWVAKTGEPLLIADVAKDPRFSNKIDKKLQQETRSLICVPLIIRGKIIGVTEVVNRKGGKYFDAESLSLFKSLGMQSAISIERARLYRDLNDLFFATIKTLASAIDAKDHYTQGHSERVSVYSVAIARGMGLRGKKLTNIRLSAMLHDIGKIGIPERILRKRSRLTESERKKILQHPTIGANMIAPIKQLKDIVPGILHHHERYGGAGYPDGLKGRKIPLIGRIIGVADAFDAMTSTRPYRNAFSGEEAIKELKRCAGEQFDPDCNKAFLNAYEKGMIKK